MATEQPEIRGPVDQALGPRALTSGLKYATAMQNVLATATTPLMVVSGTTVIQSIDDPVIAKCYQDMLAFINLARGRALEFMARAGAALDNRELTVQLEQQFASAAAGDYTALGLIQESTEKFDRRRRDRATRAQQNRPPAG